MTNTICVVSANTVTATIVFGNDVVIVVRPKDAIAGAVDVGVGVDADVNGVWVLFSISKQSKNRTNDRPTYILTKSQQQEHTVRQSHSGNLLSHYPPASRQSMLHQQDVPEMPLPSLAHDSCIHGQ